MKEMAQGRQVATAQAPETTPNPFVGIAAVRPVPEPATVTPLDDRLREFGLLDAPETEDEDAAPVEEITESIGDEPESEEPEEEEQPAARGVNDWLELVATSPVRINEVPPRLRGEVITAMISKETGKASPAIEAAYRKGQEDAIVQARQQAAVAEIDALRKDDPAGFLEWEEQYPDRASAYRAIKAQRTPAPTGTPAALINAGRNILAKLNDYPEAQARITARPGDFPITEDGLAKLTEAVAEELAEAKAVARMKAGQPAAKAAGDRQEAAAARAALPKPIGGKGAATGALPTLDQLKNMSVADFQKLESTPEGKAHVNRMLSSAS